MQWFTNIHSKGAYPADQLSNFAAHAFIFEGVPVAGMEGFLQSLKFREEDRQRQICLLVGKEAKLAGSQQAWHGYLYWKGVAYRRKGKEYWHLLTRAYDEMARQCPDFRKALLSSAPILLHSIGRWCRSKTCLSWWELCLLLTRLRRKLRRETQ